MIGIKKERKLEENQKSELSYRSSSLYSKRRVVRGVRTVVRVLDQTACHLAFTRAVVRAGDRTTCRSYVSDDLSFGEGGNDVSFQLPDDRSFGSTELIFLHLSK